MVETIIYFVIINRRALEEHGRSYNSLEELNMLNIPALLDGTTPCTILELEYHNPTSVSPTSVLIRLSDHTSRTSASVWVSYDRVTEID